MQGFAGFTEDTVRFLSELTSNNEKAWFEENRARYEAAWVEPARLFVEALGGKLKKIVPGLRCEAKIDGSILRINRDVRFSKNKAPYKEHFDLWFWEGAKRAYDAPGVFFRLRPDALEFGAGIYGFGSSAVVKKFRKAVMDEKSVEHVRAAVPLYRWLAEL